MYGALIGDFVGSVYEANNVKTKDFELFSRNSTFTDDSIMTLAVANGVMNSIEKSDEIIKDSIVDSMRLYGIKYPFAGYGGRFYDWLASDNPEPYFSYGNGSAMRVSSIAWIFNDLDEIRRIARLQAEVTHNHPEGIKGAEAVASAIFMARTGATKEEIKNYIEKEFDYDLDRSIDDIRPNYKFDVSCQGSVPEAIICYLEGEDFEDVLRNAISLGGDSDTIAAIACSIAEGSMDIPWYFTTIIDVSLPSDLWNIFKRFMSVANNPKLLQKLQSL